MMRDFRTLTCIKSHTLNIFDFNCHNVAFSFLQSSLGFCCSLLLLLQLDKALQKSPKLAITSLSPGPMPPFPSLPLFFPLCSSFPPLLRSSPIWTLVSYRLNQQCPTDLAAAN